MALMLAVDDYIASVGNLSTTSDWYVIDQAKIDSFADVTQDHQYIHIDEKRAAAETPFGGTIAHGFLSLSLLSSMIETSFPTIEGVALSINYGFDKIRFLAPVPAGARVRGHIKLIECKPRKQGELLSRYEVSVEIENSDKPALVAEWLGLAILEQETV